MNAAGVEVLTGKPRAIRDLSVALELSEVHSTILE
jgi:hypothetical protein